MAVVKTWQLLGARGSLLLHVPNGAKRTPAAGAMLLLMGLLPGASDLFAAANGRFGFLEMKALGKRPEPEQYAFGNLVRAAGGWWHWADNVPDALTILCEEGILRQEAMPVRRRSSPSIRASAQARAAA